MKNVQIEQNLKSEDFVPFVQVVKRNHIFILLSNKAAKRVKMSGSSGERKIFATVLPKQEGGKATPQSTTTAFATPRPNFPATTDGDNAVTGRRDRDDRDAAVDDNRFSDSGKTQFYDGCPSISSHPSS